MLCIVMSLLVVVVSRQAFLNMSSQFFQIYIKISFQRCKLLVNNTFNHFLSKIVYFYFSFSFTQAFYLVSNTIHLVDNVLESIQSFINSSIKSLNLLNMLFLCSNKFLILTQVAAIIIFLCISSYIPSFF